MARSQSFARPRRRRRRGETRAGGHARYVRPRDRRRRAFARPLRGRGALRRGWLGGEESRVGQRRRPQFEGPGVAALLGAAVTPPPRSRARAGSSPTTVNAALGSKSAARRRRRPGGAHQIRDATVAERFSEQLRRLMKRVADGSTLYGTRLGRGASHTHSAIAHTSPPPLQVRALHRGQPHARAVGLTPST